MGCGGGKGAGDAGTPDASAEVRDALRANPCSDVLGSPMAGHFAWRVNGQLKCATNLNARYEYDGARSTFSMNVDTADNEDSLALAVSSWTSMKLAGVHRCQLDAGDHAEAYLDVRSGSAFVADITDCTVTLNPQGTVGDATATGTFSATGTDPFGAPLTVSDGIFDTATR